VRHGDVGDQSCQSIESENLDPAGLIAEQRNRGSRYENTGIDGIFHKCLYQIIRPRKPSLAPP